MKTLLIGNTFSGSCYTTGNVVVEINELNVLFGLKKELHCGTGKQIRFWRESIYNIFDSPKSK